MTLWGATRGGRADGARAHERYLPGIALPATIRLTTAIDEVAGAGMVLLAVPAQQLRPVVRQLPGHAALLVITAKGWSARPGCA